ncbi:MAG: hypothetical protein WCV92_02265 [Candidatus Buchananbacteria bacterium]
MKYASYPGLNEYIAMRVMFQFFGKKFADLPELNENMLRWGEANVPEYACLPLKIYMGFFKELVEQGVHDFFVYGVTDIRSCRYMDLWEGGKKILHDKGYDINIHYWGGFGGLKEAFDRLQVVVGKHSMPKLMLGILAYSDALYAVDKLNDEANRLRPREIESGCADRWLKLWQDKIKKVSKPYKSIKIMEKALKEAKKIKIDNEKKLVKVVIAGDIFKIHEPFFHFNTIKKINKLGLEAKQPISFSLLFLGQNPVPFRGEFRKRYKAYQEKAKKYLSSTPASYLDISVGEIMTELENGAKGIIHFQSFGCMPDILFKPILDRMAKDYNVPIMHYMRDTHSSDTAYQTRLEAFADLIHRKNN